MSRTVDEIKALIYAEIELKDDLKKVFENPSLAKYWGEVVHTVSVDIAVHEQMMDHHYNLSLLKKQGTVFNGDWLLARIFEFQYDATTPQVISLNEYFEPVYDPVDETKRIITHAVLYFEPARLLNVLVAKGSPPAKLSAPELAAFQDYLTDGGSSTAFGVGIGFAGVAMPANSLDPDYIWLEADIRHDERITDTVQAAVTEAILNYYYSLDKDGYLRIVSLTNAILAIDGINDVLIKNLAIRANSETFSGPDQKHYLVSAYTTATAKYPSASGYAYEEVTAGEDLATKLTFIVG